MKETERNLAPDTVSTIAAQHLLALRVRATVESVGEVRRLIVAFAAAHGARAETIGAVALAVSEAMTNAVVHGCDRDATQLIEVIADFENDAVEVVIADDGCGLSAQVPSDGLGLGLAVIADRSERFTAREREPHGTEVWMRFELP